MSINKDHFQIFQIKTIALKVNIHCHGCQEKVKKILRKIEGVYSIDIDSENQKVKVSGDVDPETLINKLGKSGKHAELWREEEISSLINGGNNNQNQLQNLIASINAQKGQPMLTPGYPNQLSYERYLKQGMDMENHGHTGWNNGGPIGDNRSGFIELEGNQLLGGFGGSFNGGLQSYHDHHQLMNMNQQNRNLHNSVNGGMGNVMVHDNMYMHQPRQLNYHAHPVYHRAHPVYHHGHRAHYY